MNNLDSVTSAIKEGFNKVNDSIREHFDEIERENRIEKESGTAVFTFPADSHDIKLITDRYKMVDALRELSEYRRSLDRYDQQNSIYVQEGKILTEEELRNPNRTFEDIEKTHSYIPISDVIDKIDDILENLWELYGEY